MSAPDLPMLLWVATAKGDAEGDAPLTSNDRQVYMILLNAQLCRPFVNGMPQYPLLSLDFRGMLGRVSPCLGENFSKATYLLQRPLTIDIAPQDDSFLMQVDPMETGDRDFSVDKDRDCTAFVKGCPDGAVLHVHSLDRPSLRYVKIGGGSRFDTVLMLNHDLPVYAHAGDPAPIAVLPPTAPFIPGSSATGPDLADNRLWTRIVLPPRMIDHAPPYRRFVDGRLIGSSSVA